MSEDKKVFVNVKSVNDEVDVHAENIMRYKKILQIVILMVKILSLQDSHM